MSDRRLRTTIAVLALIGVALAGYLTYVHYADLRPFCLSSGGCEQVQSSSYAKLASVPVALIGLIGYVTILAVTTLLRGEAGRILGAGMALVGFGFSLYLTYTEVFRIKAICQWCVGSAVLMTVLAVLTVIRLLRVEPIVPGSGLDEEALDGEAPPLAPAGR